MIVFELQCLRIRLFLVLSSVLIIIVPFLVAGSIRRHIVS